MCNNQACENCYFFSLDFPKFSFIIIIIIIILQTLIKSYETSYNKKTISLKKLKGVRFFCIFIFPLAPLNKHLLSYCFRRELERRHFIFSHFKSPNCPQLRVSFWSMFGSCIMQRVVVKFIQDHFY